MLAQVHSIGLSGVESYPVRVEVNLVRGIPAFTVVGLPAGSVREGRERVLAALRNSGFPVAPRKVTVNLAPADVPKGGSAFDLPIALGLLVGEGHLAPAVLRDTAFVGELGLDGRLRPIPGALPMAAGCLKAGFRRLVLPHHNAVEASLVEGIEVLGAGSLAQLGAFFVRGAALPPWPDPANHPPSEGADLDLADVRGQAQAKRGLEIAAAGRHHVLLLGPPGTGKTMLARRLPGLLPMLDRDEALEVTKIRSVAGLLAAGSGLVRRPPFRAPHHSTRRAGLLGGGVPPLPGEISLAHGGVLFLDELPEFRRRALEALRQPIEDGRVTLCRSRFTFRYPARFVLVAAMNPCPCGHLGDGTGRCTCDPSLVRRYRGRVSGPLLDRIDLHVSVSGVPVEALTAGAAGEASATVRARVAGARAIQHDRFLGLPSIRWNGEMGTREIRTYCRPRPDIVRLLQRALDRMGLSARAYHRILKVARTIADLDGSPELEVEHVAEAIQYRRLDRGVCV